MLATERAFVFVDRAGGVESAIVWALRGGKAVARESGRAEGRSKTTSDSAARCLHLARVAVGVAVRGDRRLWQSFCR